MNDYPEAEFVPILLLRQDRTHDPSTDLLLHA